MPVIPSHIKYIRKQRRALNKERAKRNKIVTQSNTTWRKPRQLKPKKNKFYLVQANHTFGFPTVDKATKYFKNLKDTIKGPWLVVTIHKYL